MVFVTAAAVTAGAYGAYKGGEAAVKGAKNKARDIKLERSGKAEYDAKSKERKQRLESIAKKHQSQTGSNYGASVTASSGASAAGGSSKNAGSSVEERLKERRGMKSSGGGSTGSSKKGGSVLSRFSKKN